MEKDTLIEEYKFYSTIKSSLLKDSEGKYALIKGHELLGLFDTDMDAYQIGISKFGNVPFLIIRLTSEDESYWMPTLELGLLDANY